MNPQLKRMGFGVGDRVVVIHADDVAMCQSTLGAFQELIEFRLVSSGAIMVPCPWFPAAATWARDHPTADVGIHLTLTSEWKSYRWSPLSTCHSDSGLVDGEGYFHESSAPLVANATPETVYAEMAAQLSRARKAGLEPTHFDAHMYAAMEQSFFSQYLRLSEETGIPAFVSRDGPQEWPGRAGQVHEWEERGNPVFDHRLSFRWRGDPDDYFSQSTTLFDAIQPGLTCLLIHPAHNTAELQGIVPEWRYFVRDYLAFMDPQLRDYVHDAGITVIGYRALPAGLTR